MRALGRPRSRAALGACFEELAPGQRREVKADGKRSHSYEDKVAAVVVPWSLGITQTRELTNVAKYEQIGIHTYMIVKDAPGKLMKKHRSCLVLRQNIKSGTYDDNAAKKPDALACQGQRPQQTLP